MYTVALSTPYTRKALASVADFVAAAAYLATIGEVICFEIDPDGHDAADAAVFKNGVLDIYTVERS